jgi:hypothetical protein
VKKTKKAHTKSSLLNAISPRMFKDLKAD